MEREKVINEFEHEVRKAHGEGWDYVDLLTEDGFKILELLKEQACAKIKEPDCRICGQSHCKYYHESRKPKECKSYIRMEGR